MPHLFILLFAIVAMLAGCLPADWIGYEGGTGGGQDVVTVDMPFDSGYAALCVQGPGGSYSHNYNSTRYDVDLDTPNNRDDFVYAPAGGVARVHTNPNAGFGIHVNIQMSDGTFIVLGHLKAALIEDGEEVARGQLIGIEGTTGNSTGDHVHMGRHAGSAANDASSSTSIAGLRVRSKNATTGVVATPLTSEMTCSLSSGHTYVSTMPTPRWHPDGSLIKEPGKPEVYLIEGGKKRHIKNEMVFYSHRLSFDDVALVSAAEMACYPSGSAMTQETSITAVYDNTNVWLVVGTPSDPARFRQKVSMGVWRHVLKSWGLYYTSPEYMTHATQFSPGLSQYPVRTGTAPLRDGTLVKQGTSSAVYVVAGGIAMPIETWDAYLLLDFWSRKILEVPAGTLEMTMAAIGSCTTGNFCVSVEDVLDCGGPGDVVFTPSGGGSDDPDPVDTGWWDTGLYEDDEEESDEGGHEEDNNDNDTDTDTDSGTPPNPQPWPDDDEEECCPCG